MRVYSFNRSRCNFDYVKRGSITNLIEIKMKNLASEIVFLSPIKQASENIFAVLVKILISRELIILKVSI